VDGKQRRHEREAACDDHRARVLLLRAGGHEEDRRRHGDEGGHADAKKCTHIGGMNMTLPKIARRATGTAAQRRQRQAWQERSPQHQSVIGLFLSWLKPGHSYRETS
jgi:hypothetical protein